MHGNYDYFHVNDIETLGGFTYLGQNTGKYGNENITIVTECGTGDLYMIGSTASGTFVSGDNRWSLYRITPGAIPDIENVANSTKGKDPECDARAAGTATAGRYGTLNVYCHEKLEHDDDHGSDYLNYREYSTGIEEPHFIPSPPTECSANEKCCIPAEGGACYRCVPQTGICDGETRDVR
jgi:hypothetical protein